MIVGKGPQEVYLRRLAASSTRIMFLNYVSDNDVKVALYRRALFVVLPSFYEATPMVILEAMTAGRPVIASGVGGVTDLIRDNTNGLLTRPGDVGSLRNAIKNLLDDPDIISDMSEKNLQDSKEFGYETMARNVNSIYTNMRKKKR